MKKFSLAEFVREHGQPKTAEIFGIKQSAISKALRLNRNITIIQQADGTYEGEEVRSFPHRSKSTEGHA
ncbi:TPA: hypothetical protein G8O12_003738 [Salmonella enterica]|uniref:Cro/Cl family transcriptional regulator n=1 Tax=Salmonella enterica TaxID=28901 RepID=A0A742KZI0_SALER|nr:hypothetical protein [Salmonella enterica]HAF4640725.1 hypothetical protein [Salmonella enterica]HAF4746649.1 hypothetical protein [Salmonella enterica]